MNMQNPIGILIDNFHLDTMTSVRKAAEIGAKGIQFYAKNEMDPTVLTPEKRREFLKTVNGLGMEVSALCGDIGGFKVPEVIEGNVEKTKRIFDLAMDMGTRVVTSHIGRIPAEPAHPRYQMMLAACAQIAEYAHSLGACYAIETGPESAHVLLSFIEDIGSDGIGVNLDPANIVMVTGENPAKAVRTLRGHIVHTHVKDGVMHYYLDPEVVYGHVPDTDGLRAGSKDKTPIGEGSVPWKEYLSALEEIGYKGYLTIECESGVEDRAAEIRRSYDALCGFLGR